MRIIQQIGNTDNPDSKIEEDDYLSCLFSPKKQKTTRENCSVPLSRMSRGGRVQVLPARLNYSIIETRIKESSTVYSRKRSKSGAKSMSSINELKLREAEIWCNREMVMCSSNSVEEEKDIFYKLENFISGDVVWAKSGKKYPAWPGIVIDPKSEAPESVRMAFVPEATCVMYFGYSKNGKRRYYAWVRETAIFPFSEFMERFSLQSNLYGSKRKEFHDAIGEAYLVENGYKDAELEIGQQFQKGTCTNKAQDSPSDSQGINEKNIKSCNGCGSTLSCKAENKKNGSSCQSLYLCKPCIKLWKSKQYCGVCKKTWYHSDDGDWVCCDGCEIWVHGECTNIPRKLFKNLEDVKYYCPECKAESACKPSISKQCLPEGSLSKSIQQRVLPDKVSVVCTGVNGIYFPGLHLVQCNCGSCGPKHQKVGEWERHTGSRAKKWKVSIKVKDSTLTLSKWLEDHNVHNFKPSKLDIKQLHSFPQGTYKPINPTWTSERCAVCRWEIEYDFNKIILCNRCLIAVHQDCYGAKHISDYAEWICRVCETPEIQRECCLCPVKGGALKPVDIDNLWVHVTCAWFRPEAHFADTEKMEPANGIHRIPSSSFAKACSICKQVHGACTQCWNCDTCFHITCAARAGYQMELHFRENDKKCVVYCDVHRVPNANDGIIQKYSNGEFHTRDFLEKQYQGHCLRGSRAVSSNIIQLSDASNLLSHQSEPLPAARCSIFRRLNKEEDSKFFFNSKERLKHLQRTEKYRVCFGKSGIHGWGLFARRHIQAGEMVIEYRGEKIRPKIADLREAQYLLEGKDCYLFKINEELVIDSTNKGCMARFFNHSGMPNCYYRILMEEEESRLVLFAKIDVAAGDELTMNYRFDPAEKEDQKCMRKYYARIITAADGDCRLVLVVEIDVAAGDELSTCDYLFGPDEQDDLKVNEWRKSEANLVDLRETWYCLRR